jgi:hypothetical protein
MPGDNVRLIEDEAPTWEMPVVSDEIEEPERKEAPGSILSALRLAAEVQQEEVFTDIPVGGAFGDLLWIRYRPMSPDAMDRFVRERQKITLKNVSVVQINMDAMARCCMAIVGKDSGNEEILSDDDGPVRLEHRLVRLLGLPVPPDRELTSREVILRLFGNNGGAIVAHATLMTEWLQNPTKEDGEPEPTLGEG